MYDKDLLLDELRDVMQRIVDIHHEMPDLEITFDRGRSWRTSFRLCRNDGDKAIPSKRIVKDDGGNAVKVANGSTLAKNTAGVTRDELPPFGCLGWIVTHGPCEIATGKKPVGVSD